jgi:hypothetical protein
LVFEHEGVVHLLDEVGYEEAATESVVELLGVRFEPLPGGRIEVRLDYTNGERVWETDGPGSEQGWREYRSEEHWVCGPVGDGFGCEAPGKSEGA